MLNTLSLIASFCVALTLFAATYKVRFGLDDTTVLVLPTLVLIGTTLIANSLTPKLVAIRIKCVCAVLLLASAAIYPFALGNFEETALFTRFMTNCALGAMVAFFPWNKSSLDAFLTWLIVLGCIASISTILTLENEQSSGSLRSGYSDEIRDGYLSVTFATGLACIAALHRLIEKFTPIAIGAFVLCWVGIALSLGRGSLLFCGAVSLIYLIVALRVRISSMGKVKKTGLLLFFVGMIPVVFYKAMSVERTAERMLILFTDTESGAGVAARLMRYEIAQKYFLQSPFLGNGMGAYLGDPVFEWGVGHPHNMLLQFAVDGGLISLLFLCIFLTISIFSFFRGMKTASASSRNTVLAFGALFLYMSMSYMKSHDAYKGREFVILSAFPIAAYMAIYSQNFMRKLHNRRRRRSTR